MTTYTSQTLNKELSWYARLTYIIKNSKSKGTELRRYKHEFLKRLDMYYDLLHDEKEKAKVKMNPEDFFNGA
jgi:hypothetical protein